MPAESSVTSCAARQRAAAVVAADCLERLVEVVGARLAGGRGLPPAPYACGRPVMTVPAVLAGHRAGWRRISRTGTGADVQALLPARQRGREQLRRLSEGPLSRCLRHR